ncbi:MAG: hypothetical protein ACC742_05190 [Thermoanaerobaculales bacterium]
MPDQLQGRGVFLPWMAAAAMVTAPLAVAVGTALLSWTLVLVSVALTVLFVVLLASVRVRST